MRINGFLNILIQKDEASGSFLESARLARKGGRFVRLSAGCNGAPSQPPYFACLNGGLTLINRSFQVNGIWPAGIVRGGLGVWRREQFGLGGRRIVTIGRGLMNCRWLAARFLQDRRGVLMIEYALIAAVTAMIAVAAIVSAGADATVPLHRVQMALQAVLHGAHGGGGGICAPPAPHP